MSWFGELDISKQKLKLKKHINNLSNRSEVFCFWILLQNWSGLMLTSFMCQTQWWQRKITPESYFWSLILYKYKSFGGCSVVYSIMYFFTIEIIKNPHIQFLYKSLEVFVEVVLELSSYIVWARQFLENANYCKRMCLYSCFFLNPCFNEFTGGRRGGLEGCVVVVEGRVAEL